MVAYTSKYVATQTEPTLARVDKQRKGANKVLRNDELETITSTITMLSVIKDYAVNTKESDFYNATGISTVQLDIAIKKLQLIEVNTRAKKKQHSEKANNWNKTHPERHREINRDSARRNYKKKGDDQR